jgi:hypothetical protein
VSNTNAVNKGRDYCRAEQRVCRRMVARKVYPQKVSGDLDKEEIVQLGNQKYRREKVKNKIHFAGMDSQGKPITIPYQTCTLVKVREA